MRPGRSVSRWEDSRMITVCDANSLMTYCKGSVTCASVIVSVRECEIITYAGKCDICITEEKKKKQTASLQLNFNKFASLKNTRVTHKATMAPGHRHVYGPQTFCLFCSSSFAPF